MLGFDSLGNVALISSIGAVLGVAVTGYFTLLSSRKSPDKPPATAAAHRVLIETIEWQDQEITELRREVRHLETENRRLGNELKEQRSEP